MLNTKISTFARQSQLLVPDGPTRRIVLPAIVGTALGSFLTVPQGADLHPNTSFLDNHATNIASAASYINEQMFCDVRQVQEAARNMYMLRWRIVNGQPSDYSVNPEFDWLATAIGIAPLMSLEVYNAIKACGLGSVELLAKARHLVYDLKTEKKISL